MALTNLPISVCGVYGQPSPRRLLRIECRISNPLDIGICIIDSWVRVDALNSLMLADGKIFQQMHNAVDPAVIPSKKQGIGAFHIELPPETIRQIEIQRAGGDVTLRVISRVLISEVGMVNGLSVLQLPVETQFGNEHSGQFEYRIPQSEWIKLLKNLAWSELEIIELPLTRIRSAPPLARAFSRFEDAQRSYRNGHWDETMLNCRKVFEAIVNDGSGAIGMGRASTVFESILGEGEKTKRFDELARALGNFLHLGRHDNPDVSIQRADAELALWLTGSLLSYLGQ